MGFLSGKFNQNSFLSSDDVRGAGHTWAEAVFKNGRPAPEVLEKLNKVRDILTSNGRTLVQGSLAWIWAKSSVTIPIPGFKTPQQIMENARAMELGKLTPEQMQEINQLLY